MKVKLKYFGMIAEAIQQPEEEMELAAQTTALALRTALERKYATLANMSSNIAVNQHIADDDTIIRDQDEVALLPPFAGG